MTEEKEQQIEETPEETVATAEETTEESSEVTEETTEVVEEKEPSLYDLFAEAEEAERRAQEAEQTPESTEEVGEQVEEPEVTEESVTLPEYTKHLEGDVDLSDPEEVDLINAFGGGPKTDWVKHPEKMSDDQKKKFGRHMSARENYKNALADSGAPVVEPNKIASAAADIPKLVAGDEEILRKYGLLDKKESKEIQPKPEAEKSPGLKLDEEKLSKLAEAINDGDRDVIKSTLGEVLGDVVNRVSSVESKATESALKAVKDEAAKNAEDEWLRAVAKDHEALTKEFGSAYTQYSDKIQSVLNQTLLGLPNPITGTYITTPREAYDLVRKFDTGGDTPIAKVVPRPEASPPQGSAGGSEPDFTESDFNGDSESFMYKAWEQAQKQT